MSASLIEAMASPHSTWARTKFITQFILGDTPREAGGTGPGASRRRVDLSPHAHASVRLARWRWHSPLTALVADDACFARMTADAASRRPLSPVCRPSGFARPLPMYWSILAVAVGGAVAGFARAPQIAPEWRLFVITGMMGGLSTFSTFSAEVVQRLQDGRLGWAAGEIVIHVGASLVMTVLGIAT